MRSHDRYKPMAEGDPLIVLQKPGEAPVRVDPKKGYAPEKTTSRSDRERTND